MLDNTPILSKYTSKTMDIYQDICEVVESRGDKTNKEINEDTLDLMLKYDVITTESAEKLINSNKVTVSDGYEVVKKGTD